MPDTAGPPRQVVVRAPTSGLLQSITVGRHELTADEPLAAGGTDRGPGPYDLVHRTLTSEIEIRTQLAPTKPAGGPSRG